MEKFWDCGVVCPETIYEENFPPEPEQFQVEAMKSREGWAFTIRKSVLKKIPAIPEQLKTFCGDDWFWVHTMRQGQVWLKMKGICIYHYIGVSVRERGLRITMRKEQEECAKLLRIMI